MIREIKEYDRLEIFNKYNSCDNPFIILTTRVNITSLVKYCKKKGNFYATFGYIINKTVNKIDNFKYRYIDNKFYYCDLLNSSYTEMINDDKLTFFTVNYNDNYNIYIDEYKKEHQKAIENNELNDKFKQDEIWMSCVPWFNFSGLIPPFSKSVTIPQFIWDKYTKDNDEYYINLMIMVHHGFVDGQHIRKFINELENNIKHFKGE